MIHLRIMEKGESVTVKRKGTPTFYKGKASDKGLGSSFTVIGSVQPLTGNDLLRLTEGERTRENYWFFTKSEVKVKDHVVRNSEQFEVETVEHWVSYSFSYYKARMVKKNAERV